MRNNSTYRNPVVLTYYTYSDRIGGPLTYIKTLMDSSLQEVYTIKSLFQEKAPGGIDIPLLRNMVRAIRQEAPDILHVQGAQSEGFYGVLAGKLAGCKHIVLTVHGFAHDDSRCRGIKHFLYKYGVEPLTMRLADRVYCVCESTANRKIVKQNAGNGRRNCGFIHNCAPDVRVGIGREQMRQQLGITQEETVFCFCGRLSREKGLDILQEAVQSLNRMDTHRFRLLVIGDGEYRGEFEAAMEKEIACGQVIMTGQTECVMDYLGASDGFIFPSYHENLSIALLEACTAGLACIVSNVGGNKEIIKDGVTGLVVDKQNGDAYANAIRQLLGDPELMAKYQEAAKRDVAQRFSKEHMAEEVRKVYEDCLKQR